LPYEVRTALVAASKLPDPMERRQAIEAATERAKRICPQYFPTTEKEPS
jgi:hypothetical protein